MAKSFKYKEIDTYHDAGNVYDFNQGKTQEEFNASLTTIEDYPISGALRSTCKVLGKICVFSLAVTVSAKKMTITGFPNPVADVVDFAIVGSHPDIKPSCYLKNDGTGLLISVETVIGNVFLNGSYIVA